MARAKILRRALPSEEGMQVLTEALPALLSPNAAVRQQAEASLESLKGQPDSYLPALAEAAMTCQEPEIKQMAIVVLKRGTTKGQWDATSPAGQEAVKSRLLELLGSGQQSVRVLTTLTNTVAAVASCVSDTGGKWDALLPAAFTSLTSQDTTARMAGLSLLSDLAYQLPAAALEAFLPHVAPVFAQAMSTPELRVQAVKTATSLIIQQAQEKSGDKKVEHLTPITATMLDVLSACVASGDAQGARDVLSSIIDLAAEHPGFIRSSVQAVMGAALSLARNASVDESVRFTAIELLVIYAETKPVVFRKTPGALEGTIQALVECIDHVEEDEDWSSNQADKEERDEEQEEVEMAEGALERIICAAGGNKTVPLVLQTVQQRVKSSNWQHRYSALRALGILAGAAGEALNDQVPTVLSCVLDSSSDPNPRVSWAGLGALAALLSCYGPDVQSQHHAAIMPVLARLLSADVHPRLRSRAVKCIVDFMAECTDDEAELVDGYADGILTVLTEMVVSGSVAHKLCAVSAISAVAVALGDRFTRFYSHLMPGFVQMLSNVHCHDAESRELRGLAMECVSCIADAVGGEVFGSDAPAVMEVLMAGHKGEISPDDPQVNYLLQASARIAKCMQASFTPYMAQLLPTIMAFAALDPKLDLQSADDGEGDGEAALIDIKGMGKMRVSINIKELEDKALGLTTLGALAEALKDNFMPYIDQAASHLIPAVTYKLSNDVRIAAVEAMPDLVRAFKAAVDKGTQPAQGLAALFGNIWTQLMQAVISEPDAENQMTIFESVAACIDAYGPGCLSDEMQLQLCQALQPTVQDHLDGASKEEEDEDEDEDKEGVLKEIVEVLCAALKAHGGAFVPKVQQTVLPLFGQMLAADRTPEDKSAALNVLVDLVEHGQEAAQPLVSNVAAACLQNAGDANCHIRRSACFGLAVCAQHGGASFAPMVPTCLQTMHGIVTAAGSREGENKEATDNAIDAIGRMCKYQGGGTDMSQVIPSWISWLPLRDDEDCAAEAHSYLAELLETGNSNVVPAMSDALRAVATIRMGTDKDNMGDAALRERLGRALTGVPPASLAEARASLGPLAAGL